MTGSFPMNDGLTKTNRSSPLRGGFLSPPALREEAHPAQPGVDVRLSPTANQVRETLKELDLSLSEVILIQRGHVEKVCAMCSECCCKKIQFLFDENDVIFLRLTGERPPPRKVSGKKNGCRFLSPGGCILSPKARPFVCHRFICPALELAMEKEEPGVLMKLRERFERLEMLRSRLWREYLDSMIS